MLTLKTNNNQLCTLFIITAFLIVFWVYCVDARTVKYENFS